MVPNPCALETDFPGPAVGTLAERESWRKEIHRPATHTHKWWAQRLGTVFRALLAAAVTASRTEVEAAYAAPLDLTGLVVLDPFAGSGTTAVEARKTGATVVARDINPVATLVQRQALQAWNRDALCAAYAGVERAARASIDELHVSAEGDPVLYYFWVAVTPCPSCRRDTELFSSYVFARHAYPRRHPLARASCPRCHAVEAVDLSTDRGVSCSTCGMWSEFEGPVNGQQARCAEGHRFRVIDALAGRPPTYRMYAKLVLGDQGLRRYESIDDFDRSLYRRAERLLAEKAGELVLPHGYLEDGYNTQQAIRWGFREW